MGSLTFRNPDSFESGCVPIPGTRRVLQAGSLSESDPDRRNRISLWPTQSQHGPASCMKSSVMEYISIIHTEYVSSTQMICTKARHQLNGFNPDQSESDSVLLDGAYILLRIFYCRPNCLLLHHTDSRKC